MTFFRMGGLFCVSTVVSWLVCSLVAGRLVASGVEEVPPPTPLPTRPPSSVSSPVPTAGAERGETAPPPRDAFEVEQRAMWSFENRIKGDPIPWDDTVPPGAHPDAVAGLFASYGSDGVRVLDLRCESYPCLVVAEHPSSLDLFTAIGDQLQAEGEGLTAPGMPLSQPPGSAPDRMVSVMTLVGEDLSGGDAHALGEVFAEAFAIMRPVAPDSVDAGAPVFTGSGWPD